jgi:putative DNA primase/helicase
MFRAIAAWTPTLLIDEADSFARDNEELRGVLNSGHTRTRHLFFARPATSMSPGSFLLGARRR